MSGTKNHRAWGWIRKRASGRYQASYIGPDGNRHNAPNTFEAKMDAEHWLANERRDIESAQAAVRSAQARGGNTVIRLDWASPAQRKTAISEAFGTELTLSEYGKQWINQRDLKPRTKTHYASILQTHIGPKLGSASVSTLRPAAVRAWYASTLKDKPTMRSHAYQLLHAICKTAVADELLDRNPCQIEGATVVKRSRQAVVPDITELGQIADTIEAKWSAFILISAWCGLRYGEVSELRRKDISDGAEIITVARGATHRTAKQVDEARKTDPKAQRCTIDTPKSGKGRTVVVPPHIREAITKHLSSFVGSDGESLLFAPVRGGCHVSDKVVRDALTAPLAAVNRTGMRLHDLRHFAGHQTARVANLPETMARLGHSTSTASLRYQGQVSGRAVEVAEALSALATTPKLAVVADQLADERESSKSA